MLPRSVDRLSSLIKPGDLVLDVGGWACPFNRADYILDAEPFETRGFYAKHPSSGMPAFQGPKEERFTQATWIQRDICSQEPWPFHDKQFDWCICSHVLEDIRDPLGVCREMSRVAKRGYIETPSRMWETCRGCEDESIAGLAHHRWLIESTGPNTLKFWMKFHSIHSRWRYSFPPSVLRGLTEEQKTMTLWWEGSINAEEVYIHELEDRRTFFEEYVQRHYPYPSGLLALDNVLHELDTLRRRIRNRIRRHIG